MRHKRAARIRTQKIIDRLLYEPQKHKQKFTKALRQKIQVTGNGNVAATPSTSQTEALKFGSININGLGIESQEAIRNLISTHSLDVSYNT